MKIISYPGDDTLCFINKLSGAHLQVKNFSTIVDTSREQLKDKKVILFLGAEEARLTNIISMQIAKWKRSKN